MRRRNFWISVVSAALLVVLVLVVASCGSTTTTTSTSAAPPTTAAPTTTTAAPTTTTAAPTTTTAAPTTTTAAPTTTTVAIDPKALFTANCQLSGCHNRVPKAALATVTKIIQNGKESMPGFADKLTAEEIAALAAWVANGGN
jgi:mono/diheme cytochrome c family protein